MTDKAISAAQQARMDALADAETLRLCCDGGPTDAGQPWFSTGGITADNLWIARWNGARSIAPSKEISTPDLAAACARIAAHAAFRAVPGLRG